MLIPGVGAQGGDLEHSVKVGNQSGVGLINISRRISFAGDMSEKAIRSATVEYVNKMRNCIT
jgi:orotidine-5'-phosphate decarboxylase